METTNIFEKGTREGVKYNSHSGLLTIENLWELPVKAERGGLDLDKVSQILLLEQSERKTLVKSKSQTKSEQLHALKVDILTHIINVKEAEAEAKIAEKVEKEKARRQLEVLEAADEADEIEKLKAMSAEDRAKAKAEALAKLK